MDAATKALKPQYRSFEKTGDIYCLFYELGVTLLKRHGILAFITSNKWMRAAYGKSLRDFFLAYTQPIKIIDFAGKKVFDSATVDVNIMILEKEKCGEAISACTIKENCSNNMSGYIERNAVFTHFEVGQSWAILSPIEQSIKRKIEAVGKPLKDWDVRINYGIKTGFNDAFIINGQKKDELIAKDPQSAEIIRPILRGRDIKRYGYDFHDTWLIVTHNGQKENNIPRVDVTKYPAIKAHLEEFYPQLVKRQDKGDTPYNLRNCAYMEDFSKQKIIYSEITDIPNFAFDKDGKYYINNKVFMICTNENIEYLYYYLNSKFCEIYFKFIASTTGVGTTQWFKYKIEDVPIPTLDSNSSLIQIEISSDAIDRLNELWLSIFKFNDAEVNYLKILSTN